MLLELKSLGPNFTAVLWSEAFYRQFANKLLVALWKYVTAGVVIEGAEIKAAA